MDRDSQDSILRWVLLATGLVLLIGIGLLIFRLVFDHGPEPVIFDAVEEAPLK
jgi:hypothetical protein